MGDCDLCGMTEARGAGGGTDAGEITEATDAEVARGAGAATEGIVVKLKSINWLYWKIVQ